LLYVTTVRRRVCFYLKVNVNLWRIINLLTATNVTGKYWTVAWRKITRINISWIINTRTRWTDVNLWISTIEIVLRYHSSQSYITKIFIFNSLELDKYIYLNWNHPMHHHIQQDLPFSMSLLYYSWWFVKDEKINDKCKLCSITLINLQIIFRYALSFVAIDQQKYYEQVE
jgi:hypothetical protein